MADTIYDTQGPLLEAQFKQLGSGGSLVHSLIFKIDCYYY